MGDGGVVTWRDYTWRAGVSLYPHLPHPRLWSCTYAHLFSSTWSRGIGGVQLVDFTWCMGAWPPPHPSIGSRTRATICQNNFNYHSVFKSKRQNRISKLCHHTLDVGSGDVHCLDLVWRLVGGGSLAGPPPTDWVVHARYHLPISKLNIHI